MKSVIRRLLVRANRIKLRSIMGERYFYFLIGRQTPPPPRTMESPNHVCLRGGGVIPISRAFLALLVIPTSRKNFTKRRSTRQSVISAFFLFSLFFFHRVNIIFFPLLFSLSLSLTLSRKNNAENIVKSILSSRVTIPFVPLKSFVTNDFKKLRTRCPWWGNFLI